MSKFKSLNWWLGRTEAQRERRADAMNLLSERHARKNMAKSMREMAKNSRETEKE